MPNEIVSSKKALNEAAREFDDLVEINDEMRDQIHLILLEMYDDLKKICDANGITLYLSGGTALGALRHKGFIPWDDDLDVNISRADYEKLKDIFAQSELNEKYILNAPNYSEYPKNRFPQIIKRGTLYEEITDASSDKELKGFTIDVFIVDDVPNFIVFRIIRGLRCNALEFIATKVQGEEIQDNTYKELMRRTGRGTRLIYSVIGKIFSVVPSTTWNNRIDKCVNVKNSNSKFCTIATGRGHYFGELLPREVFYPATETEFCRRTALIFHDTDRYLENLYGDYMTEPPVEKRERHFVKNINFGAEDVK